MPPIEDQDRHQTAVLWQATGRTDRKGVPILQPPEEVVVRWESVRSESRGEEGDRRTLDATVITHRDIPVGSQMWLGTLDDYMGSTGTGSAGADDEMMEVISADKTPDIVGRSYQRSLGLAFVRDKTPRTA